MRFVFYINAHNGFLILFGHDESCVLGVQLIFYIRIAIRIEPDIFERVGFIATDKSYRVLMHFKEGIGIFTCLYCGYIIGAFVKIVLVVAFFDDHSPVFALGNIILPFSKFAMETTADHGICEIAEGWILTHYFFEDFHYDKFIGDDCMVVVDLFMEAIAGGEEGIDIVLDFMRITEGVVDHPTLRDDAFKFATGLETQMVTIPHNIIYFIDINLVFSIGDDFIDPLVFRFGANHSVYLCHFLRVQWEIICCYHFCKHLAPSFLVLRLIGGSYIVIIEVTEGTVSKVVDETSDLDKLYEAGGYLQFGLAGVKGAHGFAG